MPGLIDYLDRFGLMKSKPTDGPSGNALLYTAEALALCEEKGTPYPIPLDTVRDALKLCRVLGIDGWYTRHPTDFRNDQEGPDDYIGLAYLSVMLDQEVARSVLKFGDVGFKLGTWSIPYYFPNEEQYQMKFGWRAYLGRFPAVFTSMKHAAGVRPNFIERTYWCFLVGSSGMFGSAKHDPWILSWMMIKTFLAQNRPEVPKGWIEEKAIKTFNSRLKKAFAGGMSQVFKEYFQDDTHPMGDVKPFI